jgi:hypothetical protein
MAAVGTRNDGVETNPLIGPMALVPEHDELPLAFVDDPHVFGVAR